MDDWFCLVQESSLEGEYAQRFRKSGDRLGVSPVPLRPEGSQCGRLRPPSRLKMNSLRSALTAAEASHKSPDIRAKENIGYELTQPQ
jgi:hypothetical protein